MEFEELTPEQIAETLSAPAPSRRRRKEVVIERTVSGWFRLSHKRGSCGNPDCIDPRPSRTEEDTTMVYEFAEGVTTCRYCFLEGYGSNA